MKTICMHRVTDEHGATLGCVAKADVEVKVDVSDAYPPSLRPAIRYDRYCSTHAPLYPAAPAERVLFTPPTL